MKRTRFNKAKHCIINKVKTPVKSLEENLP